MKRATARLSTAKNAVNEGRRPDVLTSKMMSTGFIENVIHFEREGKTFHFAAATRGAISKTP